jgi:hypothetical protein
VHRLNTSSPNPSGGSIWSAPALNASSNTVFITTGNPLGRLNSTYGESIVSLNASTLSPDSQWTVPPSEIGVDSDFGTTPTLYNLTGHPALVSAGNKNGYLYTWFQSNLTLVWQKKVTHGTYAETTTEMNGHLFGATPQAYIGPREYNSTLFSINPLDGSYLWRTGLPGRVGFTYGAPIWINGVLVVNDGSYLVLVDAFNGKILYESELAGGMVPPISAWGSEVLVGHGDDLTAFAVGSPENYARDSLVRTAPGGSPIEPLLARVRDG